MSAESLHTHTPGPWATRHHDAEWTIYPTWKEDGSRTGPDFAALLHGHEEIQEANARLIAAAPEMLDACRMALSELEKCGLPEDDEDPEAVELWNCLTQVVRKAEGR